MEDGVGKGRLEGKGRPPIPKGIYVDKGGGGGGGGRREREREREEWHQQRLYIQHLLVHPMNNRSLIMGGGG